MFPIVFSAVACAGASFEAFTRQDFGEVQVAEIPIDRAQMQQRTHLDARCGFRPQLQDLAELVLAHRQLAERLERGGHAPARIREPFRATRP
jgi:hypothetical protein